MPKHHRSKAEWVGTHVKFLEFIAGAACCLDIACGVFELACVLAGDFTESYVAFPAIFLSFVMGIYVGGLLAVVMHFKKVSKWFRKHPKRRFSVTGALIPICSASTVASLIFCWGGIFSATTGTPALVLAALGFAVGAHAFTFLFGIMALMHHVFQLEQDTKAADKSRAADDGAKSTDDGGGADDGGGGADSDGGGGSTKGRGGDASSESGKVSDDATTLQGGSTSGSGGESATDSDWKEKKGPRKKKHRKSV